MMPTRPGQRCVGPSTESSMRSRLAGSPTSPDVATPAWPRHFAIRLGSISQIYPAHLQSSDTKDCLKQSRRDETIESGSFSADRSLLWVSASQHGKVDKPRPSSKRLGMPHHRPDPRFQAPGPRPFDDEAGKRATPSRPSWRAGLDHPLFVMRRRLSFYKTLCSSPHPG